MRKMLPRPMKMMGQADRIRTSGHPDQDAVAGRNKAFGVVERGEAGKDALRGGHVFILTNVAIWHPIS